MSEPKVIELTSPVDISPVQLPKESNTDQSLPFPMESPFPESGPVEPQAIPPPPPTEEEIKLKRELISNILDYQHSRFRERILQIDNTVFNDLQQLPIVKLEERVEFLKAFVIKRSASHAAIKLFDFSLTLCDQLFTFAGYNVTGIKSNLMKNDNVLDTVEEIKLKRASKMYTEPETRLAYSVVNAYLSVPQIQDIYQEVYRHLETEATSTLKEKFSDI